MRLFAVFALALATTAAGEGADTVRTATLDLVVTDLRGRPVEQLTPADLAVSEQGQPLAIESLRLIRRNGGVVSGSRPDGELTEHGRLIAIFLDEFHVAPGFDADRARDELVRFVANDLGPADRLVVLKPLDPLLNIQFTTDRAAAVQAISSFAPRRGDYTARTTFERSFIAGAPAQIRLARAQIATSSMNALVTALGALSSARKTLIVVSDGFTRSTSRRVRSLPGLAAIAMAANRAHVSVYPIALAQSPESVSSGEPIDELPDDRRNEREALLALAADTSGRVIAADDIQAGLRGALNDASSYFFLTLTPPTTHADGRLHQVEVAARRASLRVRARKGYWSATEEELRGVSAYERPTSSPAAQVPRRTSTLIQPWFGMSPGPGGSTRVSFVWEPAARAAAEQRPSGLPARVTISVTAPDGSSIFSGAVAPAGRSSAAVGAFPTRASFDTDARRVLIQMVIEDAASRVLDRDARDLPIGEFSEPVSLGTAEFLRARTARERLALVSDPFASPVAARSFSRAETLVIRIPVSGPAQEPRVTARLVSAFGADLRDLVATPTPGRAGVFEMALPLASLASGAYAIELRVVAVEGVASERIAFRVTP